MPSDVVQEVPQDPLSITTWTNAPIPWPRCQRVDVRGGSGLLVDDVLLRAIRAESSLALQYWFGVNYATVCRWRKTFGITQWGTEGSQRLHESLSERGAAQLRGKKLPKALVKRRIEIRAAKSKTGWQQWQLDLLGTAPDAELAARFGRSANAVRIMRRRLGLPSPRLR